MPTQKEPITLHGEKAELFRQYREALTEYLGYEPSKPETIGRMMAEYEPPRPPSDSR